MGVQQDDIYDNIALSFSYENEVVDGILNGSHNHWTFSSKSPSFLKLAPSGIFLYTYGAPVPQDWTKFHAKLMHAAKQTGLAMPE
jgi:hypothetical protein